MGPRKPSRALESRTLEPTLIVNGIFGSKNLRNDSNEMIFEKHITHESLF